jgi:citrate lyase beta subunit
MQNYDKLNDLPYRVGGLLYTPALNSNIGEKLVSREIKNLTSIALCLEDSITDDSLPQAEQQLKKTLLFLMQSKSELPLLFVRVRSVDHLQKIHTLLGEAESIITGYVLPKFDLSNSELYCRIIREYNLGRTNRLYIMPILESRAVADIGNRVDILWAIKEQLDKSKDYILNIRVGGNDFSNMYGIRRTESQNIYQIGVIRDILVNIINVFASDYVVSGPVWEYFGSDISQPWAVGLRKELELDQLNGFIGKTAIHPSQLPIIFESLKVRKCDYEDAVSITGWSDSGYAVAKSHDGQRMNEVKCHLKWAKRILTLAEIYGIRED